MHALEDNGEAEILAISYNEVQENAASAIDAINTWYGRGDIPIGLYTKPLYLPDTGHSFYIDSLAEMPHSLDDNIVGDAQSIYRQILSSQPDKSVTIISVGFLNNLYDLLKQDPELVFLKVNKLVLMGGVAYDEFNFIRHDLEEQTQYVIENWPGPIVVSQEGVYIKTGKALEDTASDNPVRMAYYKWFGDSFQNRSSWDQVAVLYGVRGSSTMFDEVSKGEGRLESGYIWKMEPGQRMYLSNRLTTTEMAEIIEALMIQAPSSK